MSIGSDIDRLWQLRENKRELEEKVKAVEAEAKTIEQSLMENMRAEGVKKSTGKKATFSFKPSLIVSGSEINWDLFYAFLIKNKSLYMLERRPSVSAMREYFESKGVGLDEDGHVLGQKMADQLYQKYGFKPFVKFTPTLTTLKS